MATSFARLTWSLAVIVCGWAAMSDAQTRPAPVAALTAVPKFQADPTWPVLPADFTWGQVIGIFADARGHVWTSSRGRISEWDPQGKLVQSWDARGPDGKWNTIHGLFVDHNGFVWTNARESQLTVKFTRTGQVALVIGKMDQTGGSNDTILMGRPSEIWVDSADNEVFVADGYGNRRIIVFDGATGRYLRHWGAYGKRPDDPAPQQGGGGGTAAGAAQEAVPAAPPQQFRVPHGIIGSRDGLIYLADRANNRVQVFRQSGEFVREKILRPRCGAQEKATWAPKRPCGIEAAFSIGFSHDAPQTYMYIADGGTHVITVVRRSDLEVVDEFGGPGVGPGQLGRPHNLTVDPSGNIYVAEAAGSAVKHPTTGAAVEAGFRAQKFALLSARGPLQADLSRFPDYALTTMPTAPVAPSFVIEHRTALHGKTVTVRGKVVRAQGPDGTVSSAGGGIAPQPGRFAQPRLHLADVGTKEQQTTHEVMVLLREGDSGYAVGQVVDIEGTVEATPAALTVRRVYANR